MASNRGNMPLFKQGIPALAPEAQVAWVKGEVERLHGFLTRYDEQFRLIAEAAGADGTTSDDWRALVDKPGVALQAVQELRRDYEEAISGI